MASGHQVRESALPIGRAAASVPPPASRAASRQASARRAGLTPPAPHFLLLSMVRGAGAGAGADTAGSGQCSPVTVDRRRERRAVAAAVSAAAVNGRPDTAAAHAPTVHQEA